MRYKFGDSNIVICYIKELLHSFNLPKAQVYTEELEENNSFYEGKMYIKDNLITRYIDGEFKKLDKFIPNFPILNFTKNFIIKSDVYDNYTHYYLGNYLRFIRDYYKINLMGMYNCFAAQEPGRLVLVDSEGKAGLDLENGTRFNINTSNKDELYYIVPVKFDQVYTIAMNVSSGFDLACILYGDTFISNTPEELIKESYKHIGGSTFYNPFTYSTKFNCTKEKNLWNKEKSLNLIIKLPKNVNTSIVILEGDFTQSTNVAGGYLYPSVISGNSGNNSNTDINKYLSKLELLSVDDKLLYPFSDRLVEYLLKNAITSNETIPNNIEYVQDLTYTDGIKGVYGIWGDNLRSDIYNKTLKTNLLKSNNKKYSPSFIEYDNKKSITIPEGAEIKYILYAPSLSKTESKKDPETGEPIEEITFFDVENNSIFELTKDDFLRLSYTIPGNSETEDITVDLGLLSDGIVINNLLGDKLINEKDPDWNDMKPITVEDKCFLQISSTLTEKKEIRFIDSYYDITGFVDKDVENLLKLQSRQGVK